MAVIGSLGDQHGSEMKLDFAPKMVVFVRVRIGFCLGNKH